MAADHRRGCFRTRRPHAPDAAAAGPATVQGSGTSNANLVGGAKYEFGGVYFAFFTVNTAKYSPEYFRICEYGPYLAFLPPFVAVRPYSEIAVITALVLLVVHVHV